jgi:hypothetical protein
MSSQLGREIKFTEVLEQLMKWRHELVEQMRNPSTTERARQEILQLKVQLDQAIASLQLCEKYQIFLGAKVIEIPTPPSDRLSEYHLMDDCGLTERNSWVEVTVDGKPIRISPSSLIVEK